MTVWVTSDHHFGHGNVIKFCKRPWTSVRLMNEGLIERHNQFVKPDDIVFFLGDVSFMSAKWTSHLLRQMNGHKTLIHGNHDSDKLKKLKLWRQSFASYTFSARGYTVHMTHYPPKTCEIMVHDALWLHGHLHSDSPGQLPVWDVGVDAHNYAPVRLDDIIDRANERKTLQQRLVQTL